VQSLHNTFSFFISLINPQLTFLSCNFSYGSKKGPAKYFWDTKSGGAIFEISPTSKSKGLNPSSPKNPAPPPLQTNFRNKIQSALISAIEQQVAEKLYK